MFIQPTPLTLRRKLAHRKTNSSDNNNAINKTLGGMNDFIDQILDAPTQLAQAASSAYADYFPNG